MRISFDFPKIFVDGNMMTSKFINVLLHILFTATFSSCKNVEIRVKAVPPIYRVEVKHVTLYEATLPIFFHVKLPKIQDEFIRDFDTLCKARRSENETKTLGLYDEYYCKLEKQFILASNHIMKDLQLQRTEELRMNGSGWEGNGIGNWSRAKRQATPVIVGTSLLAGFLLRPALATMTRSLFADNNNEWIEHYNAVRNSLLEEHKILLEFEQSAETFAQEMTSILANISEIIIAEKQDLIGSLHLLTTKVHTDFIQDAARSCKSNLLPANLVQHEFLKSTLTKLDQNLTNTNLNYSLAIEYETSLGLAKYFKLPISSCKFDDDKVIIMLNLPLKAANTSWKLFDLIHTKFAYNGQLCEVYPQQAKYLAQDMESNKTVLITNTMLKYCSVSEPRLCMIPRFGKESSQSLRCSIGNGDEASLDDLSTTCSFQCYTSDELIITEVDDKTLVVTNADNLTYKCVGAEVEERTIQTRKVGALEIKLDCECSIVINEMEELHNPFPCPVLSSESGRPFFSFAVPSLWTHNLSMGILDLENETEFADHINHHWSLAIPTLNFTGSRETVNFTIPEEILVSSYISTLTRVEIWLILVTVTLIFQILFALYCFFKLALTGRYSYDMIPQAHFRHIVDNECKHESEDVHKKQPSLDIQHRGIETVDNQDTSQEQPSRKDRNISMEYRNNYSNSVNRLI